MDVCIHARKLHQRRPPEGKFSPAIDDYCSNVMIPELLSALLLIRAEPE